MEYVEHKGFFTVARIEDNHLIFSLSAEGRALLYADELNLDPRDDVALCQLLEEHRDAWGLERVWPDQIGALTAGEHVLLSDDVERENRGGITRVGRLWCFPNYAIEGYMDVLRERGEIVLKEVP